MRAEKARERAHHANVFANHANVFGNRMEAIFEEIKEYANAGEYCLELVLDEEEKDKLVELGYYICSQSGDPGITRIDWN